MSTTDSRRGMVMLILATLAFALCFAVWGLISPLAPTFRELYHLNGAQVGLLLAVPVLLGSLARLPLGLLTDRYGGRLLFSALMLVLLAPVALAGLTSSFGALVGVSFFLGLAGASFAIGVPFVSRWFPPERQGFALGIYGMGNIGTAVSNFTAPRLAGSWGWEKVFWLYLPILLAMAIIFWLVARDAPGAPAPSQSLAQRFAVFREQPVAWVLALFYFVTFGGFVAISTYLPTLLVTEYHLTRTDAASRAAGFVILATLARPLGGLLSDRWGSSPLLNVSFLVAALIAIVLAFEPGMAVITAAFLGIAFMLGLGNGAVFKLVAEVFPRQAGIVTGLVGAAGGLGGFFPPLLMGTVKDATGSYAIGFMLLSEFALLCLIVNILVLQRRAALLDPTAGQAVVTPDAASMSAPQNTSLKKEKAS
ncbi:MAG TPA: nitrate/nitrite transporter [Thermomicrobiales bacterium]|nr:nitrate/nitrite transporter [Thermomicrobiales bacterium]